MKILYLILFLVLASTSSGQDNQTNEQILNAFIKEIISSEGSVDCASKYLNIHESYIKEDKNRMFFFKFFYAYYKELNQEIIKNNGNYQILSHKDNRENDLIKNFRLETDDYAGVYYLVSSKKVISFFIVSNGKIVSICPMLHQGQIKNPWFIDKPDSFFNSLPSK